MRTNYQNIYNTMVKEEEARKQKALAEAAMADSEYRKNVAMAEACAAKKKAKAVAYPKFKKKVQESFVAGFLGTLCGKVLEECHTVPDVDAAKGVCNGAINSYVEENGAMNLIKKMNGNTLFLSEAAKLLDTTIDAVLEEVDPTNTDSYVIDPVKEREFYDSLQDCDTVEDITNAIRIRVIDAEERMASDNIGDKIDMDEIVQSAKDRIEAVRASNASGDTSDASAELQQQEAVSISKVRMNNVSTKRPRSVLEQMVRSNSKAVLKDQSLMEAYSTNGQVDYDKLIGSTIAVYTLMECLNTIGLEEFTAEDIQHMVS